MSFYDTWDEDRWSDDMSERYAAERRDLEQEVEYDRLESLPEPGVQTLGWNLANVGLHHWRKNEESRAALERLLWEQEHADDDVQF